MKQQPKWLRTYDYALTVRGGQECKFLWEDNLIAAKIIEVIFRCGETYVILHDKHHDVQRGLPIHLIYEVQS